MANLQPATFQPSTSWPASGAQRGIDALARYQATVLAASVGPGRPERERALPGVVLPQGGEHMLAVDAAMLRPGAGASSCQGAPLQGNLIELARLRGTLHQVQAMLWVAGDDGEAAAGSLEFLHLYDAALR